MPLLRQAIVDDAGRANPVQLSRPSRRATGTKKIPFKSFGLQIVKSVKAETVTENMPHRRLSWEGFHNMHRHLCTMPTECVSAASMITGGFPHIKKWLVSDNVSTVPVDLVRLVIGKAPLFWYTLIRQSTGSNIISRV